jgi:hypothetical protein
MKKTLFLFLMAVTWQGSAPAADINIYVSPAGRDSNSGAKARPLASLAAAQRLARSRKSAGAVTVWLRGGTYYLPETLVFSPRGFGHEGEAGDLRGLPWRRAGHQRWNPASVDVDPVSRWHPDGARPRRPAQRPIFCERQAPGPGALLHLRSGNGVLQRLVAGRLQQRACGPLGGSTRRYLFTRSLEHVSRIFGLFWSCGYLQRQPDPFGLRVNRSPVVFGMIRRASVVARLCRSNVTAAVSQAHSWTALISTLMCQ